MYLTPYEKVGGALRYGRYSIDRCCIFYVGFSTSTKKWYSYDNFASFSFDTAEEAMVHRDNALIKAGHILLTEERFEKLKALL